jgi:streptogramin lyase
MSFVQSRRKSRTARARRSTLQSRLESLEARQLMSGILSYATGAVAPQAITADNNGNLWMVDQTGLYKIDSNGQQQGDPVLAGVSSADVVFNKVTGHIYLADEASNAILEVDTNGNLVASHALSGTDTNTPVELTVSTDGSVWFGVGPADTSVPNFPSEIGRLATNGSMTYSAVPNGGVIPMSMAASPDGSIWCTGQPEPYQLDSEHSVLSVGAEIGHAHANSDGSITVDNMYAISTPGSLPTDIAVDTDGSVWFGVAYNGDQFAGDGPDRLVHGVLSGGTLVQTEYTIPEPSGVGGPAGIALDDGGRLWFTQFLSNQMGYMDTSTGDFTLMAIPSSAANPGAIVTTGSDVWATAVGGGSDNLLHVDETTFVAPVNSTSPNINATAGTTFTGDVATFQSSDSGNISYTVDYGNGGPIASGVFTGGAGVYNIPGNVKYDNPGTYDTVVTISTSDGTVVQMHGVAVVDNGESITPVVGQGIDVTGQQDVALAPNRSVNGSPVLAVATFSGDPAPYAAVITWAPGITSQGTIVDLGGGMYAVVADGPQVYTANGVFNGSVAITGGVNDLTVGFTATISDTPLAVSTNMQLQLLNGRHLNGTVATFSDDIESTTGWFTATINWGDGSATSAGVIVQDSAGQYHVLGEHLYKGKPATYTVSTLISNTVEGTSQVATGMITT